MNARRLAEREKAAFLTAYRQVCEAHGMMVIQIIRGDDEYSPYVVARTHTDPAALDHQIQEMLVESARTIEWP